MNKAKAIKVLRTFIEAGHGLAESIIDSPHQNKDYAPYVVELLVKKTPVKQIPFLVLEKLEDELIAELDKPKKPFWKVWAK